MTRLGVMLLALGMAAVACGGDSASTTTDPRQLTSTTVPADVPTTEAHFDWLAELEEGLCFNDVWDGDQLDITVPPAVVPCSEPHDNEVAGMVAYADGPFPGEAALESGISGLCAEAYTAFFGRASRPASDVMGLFNVLPSEKTWALGTHRAACITYAGEPVAGTARSAGLSAPGEVLAVVLESDGDTDVWTLDAGTGNLLLAVPQGDLFAQLSPPGWAPDGESVLFAAGTDDVARRIYVGSPDGNAHPLEDLEIDSIGSPAINPLDGQVFAFIAAPGGGEFDVFLYDGHVNSVTQLTDSGDRNTSPNWSPDGTKIAYRARVDGNSDIWVMNRDGSDKTQITDDPAFDGDPRWSADGFRLLFTSDRTGDYEIWVMDADGGNQINLTNHPAADEFPTWSSDGAFIAFHSDRHGGTSVWLMNSDGSDQSKVSWFSPVGYPSFRPREQ